MQIEIFFQHGWGFDRSIWQKEEFAIEGAQQLLQDRGYFGQPESSPFSIAETFRVVVAHSFGLHLIDFEHCSVVDHLAIIGGFYHFPDGPASHSLFQTMRFGLQTDPIGLLQKFYRRCGLSHVQLPKQVKTSLLVEELFKLEKSSLDLETVKKKCKTISILHGKKDRVVPYQKALQLCDLLPGSELQLIEDGGHALPFSHAAFCAAHISKAINNRPLKKQITSNFSLSAERYTSHGGVQKQAALGLITFLRKRKPSCSSLSILEIGCGTGFLTEGLIDLFLGQAMTISDISLAMVRKCQQRIGLLPQLTYQVCDGERVPTSEKYDLIVSGLTFHWFLRFESALIQLMSCLKEGGMICFSLLLDSSFNQWRQACTELNIPFSGNRLPSRSWISELLTQHHWAWSWEFSSVNQSFSSPLHFFQSIKNTGTSTSLENKQLPIKEFLRLLKCLDNKNRFFETNYDLLYVSLSNE